ncbi:outer membrane beta-barrel protein [Pseudoduganella sp. S-14]|jgi:OmpA-OmpF porin, OOP family|uniref:outer membrane beta-barrel protein n=1 Tax=Pseudoduganella sp. S-14 TaxID=3404065 RepID=UPI003CEA0840
MTKLLTLSMLAASILAPLSASAGDFYAGVTGAGGGKLTFRNAANGNSVTEDSKPLLGIYGGWNFADGLALEGGYRQSGQVHFDKSALGLAAEPTFKFNTAYLAVRMSHQFNDEWSVFGKAGLARNRFSSSNGSGAHDSESDTRPLLDLGLAYNVSKAVALTLDYEYIGRTSKPGLHVKQSGLRYGLRVGF